MNFKQDEIVIQFFSRSPWDAPALWSQFYSILNVTVGEFPSRLDTNDPLRRQFNDYSLKENSEYTCQFGPKEMSRVMFGSYPKNKCHFSLHIYKSLSSHTSSLNLYLPSSKNELAEELFNQLSILLEPIYAYSYYQRHVSAKKRADFFAVDMEQELVGVFWLTFFCKTYVNYFGRDKFQYSNGVEASESDKGIIIKLSDSPITVEPDTRTLIEEIIGKNSFVDPKSTLLKPKGKYVPSYDMF